VDVGCGAGSHSLYLQNELNLEVTAIDISSNAIQACSLIKDAVYRMTLENETYDDFIIDEWRRNVWELKIFQIFL
jgi:cyclopropane fatty-acyl-phospholipid synthase-like methyltransferase